MEFETKSSERLAAELKVLQKGIGEMASKLNVPMAPELLWMRDENQRAWIKLWTIERQYLKMYSAMRFWRKAAILIFFVCLWTVTICQWR